MYKNRILIAEDDVQINNLLCNLLETEGYSVKQAFSGSEVLLIYDLEPFDLILLDLMLPGETGDSVLKLIRSKSDIPVIVISAQEERSRKLSVLISGADDYISKPFDIEEVLVRIKNILKKGINKEQPLKEPVIKYKDIAFNNETREVYVDDHLIFLTNTEMEILHILMKYPNKIFSKSNLLESVRGDYIETDEKTIHVHISNLRKKLADKGKEKDYIQTLWGIGYRLYNL